MQAEGQVERLGQCLRLIFLQFKYLFVGDNLPLIAAVRLGSFVVVTRFCCGTAVLIYVTLGGLGNEIVFGLGVE